MPSQIPKYPKERPNGTGPSDITPSGLTPAHPYNYQHYILSEFHNMFPSSVPSHGPSEMMNSIFNISLESPQYLTDSAPESDLTGNDGAIFPFPPRLLPHYGCHTVSPMQQHFRTVIPLYTDNDNRREIPIAVAAKSQEVVPVGSRDPPFTAQDASPSYISTAYLPNGSIPGAHHPMSYDHMTSLSGSTGDSASPTALQFPHIQNPSLPSAYQAFIDDHPLIHKAYDFAKGKVASYPILKASNARRKTDAPFECEICKATFTRSHNLTYHRDAHFGIKKHTSLCGKKFGTPSGSKRHQGTCNKCKGASSSRKEPPSPG